MIPVSTLLSRVRTLYEAEAGATSPVRWSNSAIQRSVNEGLETLAEATGFYERYCTLPIEANRRYYDIRGFTPETVARITSVWSTTRNEWLPPKSVEDLGSGWESATGDPYCFFTQGIYWLVVHPAPTTTTGFLRVHFAGIPGRLTHPQAVLGDLPDRYYPALEDYALYDMAAQDRESSRAITHFTAYLKREAELAAYIDRRLVASTPGRFGRMSGRL
jgi:hypothetical protein